MPIRKSSAVWNGSLKEGNGIMNVGEGVFEGAFTDASRFEDATGTNPEELLGAAHAGCFSMFLSALLTQEGFVPEKIETTAKVHLGAGPRIRLIELTTTGHVNGIDDKMFQEFAQNAKSNCPVSMALSSVEMKLTATLA